MEIVDFFARFFFAKSDFGQIFLSILKNPTTFFVLKKYMILRTYVKIIENLSKTIQQLNLFTVAL